MHIYYTVTQHTHINSHTHTQTQLLGSLKPLETKTISVSLIGLAAGVQRISGFRVCCDQSKFSADFNNMHQILVLHPDTHIHTRKHTHTHTHTQTRTRTHT